MSQDDLAPSGPSNDQFEGGESLVTVRRKRPFGITILAVLHLLGGIVLVILMPFLFAQFGELQSAGQTVGISPLAIVGGSALLAALSISSGIGLWRGVRWGWWLGAFYCVYGVARNATALLTVADMAEELADETRGAGYYLVKHLVRGVSYLLILLYYFKGNVLSYFGLSGISKGWAIARMIGVCAAISVVATVLSLLPF